eukprot:TRINITY_DN22942_c0_g1_i1.p1 TRINITY_DN22942_c0_g1~~TRINITY_DN22942_c0_g1_i1.p1  ORF type:complete len:380 (-),score=137.16 TRINITY_DN22942_c0_g1_i1:622-1761(-)
MEATGELVLFEDIPPASLTPQYAKRVGLDQFEERRNSTTQASLQELANHIRRNPSSVGNATGFQRALRRWRVRELLLRAVWTLAVLGGLFFLQQRPLATNDVPAQRLEGQLPRALCGAADAQAQSLLTKLVGTQSGTFFLFAATMMMFLSWVTSMHFENRQLQTKITLLQQAVWPVVDFAVRGLLVFAICTVLVTAAATFFSVDACLELSKDFVKLFTAEPISAFWHGACVVVINIVALLTRTGDYSVAHDPQQFEFVAFMAFVLHVLVLSEAASLLAASRSLRLADVLPAALLAVAVALPAPEGTAQTERGLALLSVVAFANLVRIGCLILNEGRAHNAADAPAVPLDDIFEADPEDEPLLLEAPQPADAGETDEPTH